MRFLGRDAGTAGSFIDSTTIPRFLNARCKDLADMAYESDVTLFIEKLKAERPTLEAEQRKGRAIWWDRDPLNMERRRQENDSRVPQKGYPYQTQV
jgi:hypothetical protein